MIAYYYIMSACLLLSDLSQQIEILPIQTQCHSSIRARQISQLVDVSYTICSYVLTTRVLAKSQPQLIFINRVP